MLSPGNDWARRRSHLWRRPTRAADSRLGKQPARLPPQVPREKNLRVSTLGSDFRATEERCVLIHAQAWRFNIAAERCAGLERAAFRGKDISFHSALDGN